MTKAARASRDNAINNVSALRQGFAAEDARYQQGLRGIQGEANQAYEGALGRDATLGQAQYDARAREASALGLEALRGENQMRAQVLANAGNVETTRMSQDRKSVV